ncbi:DUF1189 domain-containing protein [Pseudalkalibacillus berkeleyi]|uniref:DUF1189 domain-containing protein n=1 Tax=Pseudalkalibacillus berkeleyi TaxID=1069813 RepID=A0ABS9GYW5_9BACL|nr:DUF1189 domain-containing protein [Pseudalkalibacillus berkeleyi]MCF6137929.1 DUF1189 domain-containing protein [Pseudalkalibacillus berkeleyi]
MNIFKQFTVSFYSPKDMAAFRFQKIGKTIGYVFIMMLFAFIFLGTNMGLMISGFVNNFETVINDELPAFEFKDKQITSDIDKPIIYEDKEQTFIFDTTGQVTRDDLDKYSDVVAIFQDETYIITNSSVEKLDYTMMGDMNFNKEDITNLLDGAKSLLPLIISVAIIAAYIFMTALKFIGITVLALIGLIVKNVMKRKNIPYRQLWIMSAYAVTLPTILFAILESLGIMFPGQLFIYWAVAVFILSRIVKHVPVPRVPEDK